MNFQYFSPTKIIFGPGLFKKLPEYYSEFGKRPFVITSRSIPDIEYFLKNRFVYYIEDEPDLNKIREGSEYLKNSGCDLIISIGGGSIIDTGKAISATVTNPGDISDYLEVIGLGKTIMNYPLPMIAVPTTAGTGAEVTSNAVLASNEKKVKVSLRSPLLFPRLAVIDPELTITQPRIVTAGSGLDALIQLIEAYLSNKSNPMTDAFCIEGMNRISKSLPIVYNDSKNITARSDVSIAAVFSGLALSNAKLGGVHGIAGPLGGIIKIPHGIACAKLFYPVFKANFESLVSNNPKSLLIHRFINVVKILTDNSKIDYGNCTNHIRKYIDQFEIPSIKEYGFKEEMTAELIEKSKNSSSMKGNPVILSDDELLSIIRYASE